MRFVGPLGLLVAACAGPGTEPARAPDVLAAWAEGPGAAAAAVEALPPGPARILAVERLFREAGASYRLCRELPRETGERQACERLARRPHLRGVPPPAGRVLDLARPGPGPSVAAIRPARPLPPSLPGPREALPGDAARAAARAAVGDARGAARTCAGRSTEAARSECMFRAAQQAVRARGVEGLRDAEWLCGGAGAFVQRCHLHVAMDLAVQLAPPADAPAEAWRPARAAAEAWPAAWAGVDDAFGRWSADRFWSMALRVAYAAAAVPSGDPLDALPAEVHPHVRAAAAAAVLDADDPPRTLDEAVAVLRAALDRRSEGPAPPADRPVEGVFGIPTWTEDGPGDGARPAVFLFGQSRRTTSPDPAVELALCVLEAAAHRRPARRDLLLEGARRPEEPVRWTAVRLLASPE